MQRMIRFPAALAASVVVFTFAVALVAQDGNAHLGTWKSNTAKSKYAPGTAANTSTTKIEPAGAGTRSTVDTDYADGTKSHWTYTTNYDGKDAPITGNCPYGETVAVTKVDARTTRSVYKHSGAVTITQSSVVSPDSKTRTVTSKGKNLKGQAVDNMTFYEKQ